MRVRRPRFGVRFTPTCVGTISNASAACPPPAVHPHVRGDNANKLNPLFRSYGSPPRAWGQCMTPACVWQFARFTPTCVGTMWETARSRPPASVHPHVRGDNSWHRSLFQRAIGSPPRAWGQYPLEEFLPLGPRFTPTCVGTIRPRRDCGLGPPVHPHVRGDNCPSRQIAAIPERFTPTCVGTINASNIWPAFSAVHPHVRGDNRDHPISSRDGHGSPPRAWGQFNNEDALLPAPGSPPRAWGQCLAPASAE